MFVSQEILDKFKLQQPVEERKLTTDEIKALVRKVQKMDDECKLNLSSRQWDWLYDLGEHVDNGQYHRISDNAIKFLKSCESGAYGY